MPASGKGYAACSGCSLCLLVCPVWRATRDIRLTPHGRAKALQHGASAGFDPVAIGEYLGSGDGPDDDALGELDGAPLPERALSAYSTAGSGSPTRSRSPSTSASPTRLRISSFATFRSSRPKATFRSTLKCGHSA
jgi:ferredoxin